MAYNTAAKQTFSPADSVDHNDFNDFGNNLIAIHDDDKTLRISRNINVEPVGGSVITEVGAIVVTIPEGYQVVFKKLNACVLAPEIAEGDTAYFDWLWGYSDYTGGGETITWETFESPWTESSFVVTDEDYWSAITVPTDLKNDDTPAGKRMRVRIAVRSLTVPTYSGGLDPNGFTYASVDALLKVEEI